MTRLSINEIELSHVVTKPQSMLMRINFRREILLDRNLRNTKLRTAPFVCQYIHLPCGNLINKLQFDNRKSGLSNFLCKLTFGLCYFSHLEADTALIDHESDL